MKGECFHQLARHDVNWEVRKKAEDINEEIDEYRDERSKLF